MKWLVSSDNIIYYKHFLKTNKNFKAELPWYIVVVLYCSSVAITTTTIVTVHISHFTYKCVNNIHDHSFSLWLNQWTDEGQQVKQKLKHTRVKVGKSENSEIRLRFQKTSLAIKAQNTSESPTSKALSKVQKLFVPLTWLRAIFWHFSQKKRWN